MSELFNVANTSEYQRPEPSHEQLKQQLELRIKIAEIHIAQLNDLFRADPLDEWVSNDLGLAESQLEHLIGELEILNLMDDLAEL